MKTFCLFSSNYLPNVGGVERYTYNLGKELISRGYRVIIVTSNVFNIPDYEIQNDMVIYRFPCYNLLNGRFPVLKLCKNFKMLKRKLSFENIDYIIVNTRFYIHSLFGVRFAYKKNINHIVIEHGTNHLTVKNKFWDFLGHIFEHTLTFFIKRYNKDFYGVSKGCLKWLEHFNIKGLGTLYNAVDINEIENIITENKNDEYSELFGNDRKTIFFAGRLVEEKGILKLIDAVERINKNTDYKIHLIIAGDGPLLINIQNKKSSNVTLIGRIDFPRVVTLLSRSDIMCLPSESEGFPTAVLEAAACKCFCVSSNCGGVKELILNDNYGLVYENNTTEIIEQNILKALDDDNCRRTAVTNAYNRVMLNFTWKQTTTELLKIFKEMG